MAERTPLPRWLGAALRAEPATVPAAVALALCVVLASGQGGYPLTHWAPAGLFLLGLLVAALAGLRPRLADTTPAMRLALACLAAYTALSFLSITWAGVRADAWEGANRTLLYLIVFALFGLWPRRGSGGALLLGAWVLAMTVLAGVVLVHLDTRSTLAGFFKGDRLAYPSGYENASAAAWAMVMWPALMLAAARPLRWALRGAFAGGAVLLADVALLSQSRGSLFSTPVMLIAVFALFPGRLRTFATLVPVACGIAASAPAVLHVGDVLKGHGSGLAAMHSATAAIFIAALAVGVLVAAAAAFEGRRTLAPASVRAARRALAVGALVALVAVVAGGLAAAGDPVARVSHAWDTFKSGKGYAANGSGNRLFSGLGSNRYDFYRVALDEFSNHPLVGIGADNYAVPYLAHGHSGETPHYPHSVEARTLAQTGLIGSLLGLVGLVAALVAASGALRASALADAQLRRAVAAASLAGFGYWLVHGSVDWFWEFAGLGAPAFALLGLACALAPPRGSDTERAKPRGHRRRHLAAGAVALTALAAAASLTAPWLSRLEVQQAARIWPTAPASAYRVLDDAARLDPLSDEAYVLAGGIAVRLGDLPRAGRDFQRALSRDPSDAYAALELGAISSTLGQRARAVGELTRAVRLDPHDEHAREALALTRKGGRVDVYALNGAILRDAARLR